MTASDSHNASGDDVSRIGGQGPFDCVLPVEALVADRATAGIDTKFIMIGAYLFTIHIEVAKAVGLSEKSKAAELDPVRRSNFVLQEGYHPATAGLGLPRGSAEQKADERQKEGQLAAAFPGLVSVQVVVARVGDPDW